MTQCLLCNGRIERRNKSGYCRRCFHTALNNSGERLALRIEKLRKTITSDAYKPSLVRRLTDISRSRLAWCPLEYRDEYRRLTRAKMIPAAQAREMIMAQVAADMGAYHATGQLQQTRRAA